MPNGSTKPTSAVFLHVPYYAVRELGLVTPGLSSEANQNLVKDDIIKNLDLRMLPKSAGHPTC